MCNLQFRGGAAVSAVFAALVCVRSASAVVVDGETYDATTGYVLMTGNDSGSFSSITGAVHWTTKKIPEPGTNYFVQSGMVLRTPKNGNTDAFPLVTFAGDSLTLGGGQITHCLNSGMGETKAPGVQWDDLRILGGKYVAGCQLNVIRDSKITFVHSPSLGAVKFEDNQTADGSAGSGIYFRNTSFSSTSEDATAIFFNSAATSVRGVVFRNCDFTGFTGTLQFGMAGMKQTYADFGDDTVHGTVVIATNAELRAVRNRNPKLDKVEIRPGGVIELPDTGASLKIGVLHGDGGVIRPKSASDIVCMDVTGELTFDSPFLISSGFGYDMTTGTAQTVATPIMTLPEGTVVPDGAFACVPVAGGLPNIVATSENVDGKVRLSIAKKEIVTVKVRDSSKNGGSSFKEAKASNWSDGRQPHPGADYVIGLSGNGNQLMTYDTTGAAVVSDGACLFAGDSFTVLGNGTLALCEVHLNVFSNLTAVAGGTISAFTSRDVPNVLRGNTLTLLPSSAAAAMISCQNGAWIVVEHELMGSADLDICRHSNAGSMSQCRVDLTAISTNYTGRIAVACGGWRTQTNWEGNNMTRQVTLGVSDARCLGGPLPSFAYDALRVRDCQIFAVTNDVTFTDQTRGLFIDGCARFDVASGATLKLTQPLTFAGKLRKEGAGTLALGGTLAFTDERLADPAGLDGTNVLEMVAGALKPCSKTGANGLAITFASGASLALDVMPADSDVAKYGLYDVLAETPVALDSGASSIPLTFDADGIQVPDATYELGVATVKTRALAAALKDSLAPVRPWKNYVVELSLRDNPEDGGSCTVVATVRQSGMAVLFR